MFLIILLRLALLVAFSITCVVFFAILLICVVICVTMAIIRMITVTSVRRGGVMFGSFSFCIPCVNYVSAMSHARSGILLFGTAFLPSLVFPVCSSSYSFTDFLGHGYFLDVSAVYFGYMTMIIFDLDLVLSQKSYYTKVFVLWLECFRCMIPYEYVVTYFSVSRVLLVLSLFSFHLWLSLLCLGCVLLRCTVWSLILC